jgi:orotate phosphoribosyltransferase
LKSGRQSPFFFNFSGFSSGEALARLGTYYSQALQESGLNYDVVFIIIILAVWVSFVNYWPAYKGIPLVSSVAISLYRDYEINSQFCFNRKETKQHGEGGDIVGNMTGKVVVIDDVITAGTAIRESVNLIHKNNCKFSGVVIALNRQEKGEGDLSAIEQVELDYGVKVVSIVNLQDVVEYLIEKGGYDDVVESIKNYSLEYGTNK